MMHIENDWALLQLILISTEQSLPNIWEALMGFLKQPRLLSWITSAFFLVASAFLFLLDIGDKLAGVLSWLKIESPFQQSDRQKLRRVILRRIRGEVDKRLEKALHESVKLDLYMKDQRQHIGKSRTELVLEDKSIDRFTRLPPLLNRVFESFRSKTASLSPLASTHKIVEIFDQRDIQGKLLILGEPGAGKTTELLHLADDLLQRAFEGDAFPFPVILELSVWEESKAFEQWVVNAIYRKCGISKFVSRQWLQEDELILLLDGLDELGLAGQQQCIKAINNFLAEYRYCRLVVCCRREEYEAAQVTLEALNGAVCLEPLRDEQIKEFFERLNRPWLWKQIRDNLHLVQLARSPLFLSMLVVAYQGKPINSESELLDAFITEQFQKSIKDIYPQDKEPDPYQVRIYLIWLAQQLERTHETEFLIEGLQPPLLCLSSKEMRHYQRIVGVLYGLLFGLVGGLCVGLVSGLSYERIFGLTAGLLFGLGFGSLVGLLVGLFPEQVGIKINVIQIREKLIFLFSKCLNTGVRSGLRFCLFSTIGSGLLFCIVGGVIGGVVRGLITGSVVGLVIGLFGGLTIGLIDGLSSGLSAEIVSEKTFPNQGIWGSFKNTITIFLLVAISGGLYFGIISGLFVVLIARLGNGSANVLRLGLTTALYSGLIIGLFLGLTLGLLSLGLTFGLDAVIKHFALRIVLTRNGYTPWNYARFLDYADRLGILQRVGGRYRFLHDLLRKHFAAMSLE